MAPPPANPEAGEVLQAAELARVRCLLVAPFENASDAPLVGEAATGALLTAIDPARTRVFPIPELRAIFRDTPLELPQGLAPSLALELAELVGADAALYGSVDGRAQDSSRELIVTVRLALTGSRRLLFAESTPVRFAAGERPDTAVRRALLAAARPVLARLGDTGRRRCFDAARTRALRNFALAQARCPTSEEAAAGASEPAARPEPQPAAAKPSAPPKTEPVRTPRQMVWAKRLASGTRFLVEDVAFEGRTAALERDRGLQDLAAALQVDQGIAVRIEGFVDRTSDRNGDAKLSAVMAKTAAERVAALGVVRKRITFAGRGGESPILPNFTARGRAANRRLEVVVVR
jgi:outer membrane protein OmpA-like peptidoglycan-associated protein